MAGADNIKGYEFGNTDKRTVEEQRAIQSKAGKKSGESRRRKKAMKTQAKLLMGLPVPKQLQQKMKMMGIADEDTTYQMGVMVAMLQEALQGNVKAAQFVREMIGEDPKQELQRKEFKLKQDEFKYRQDMDAKAAAAEEETSSLADDILSAWEERTGGVGNEE